VSPPTLRRLVHPVYRHLESKVHPLRYLFFEITQRCNLDCRHCGSDCGAEQRVGALNTAEWLELVDEVADKAPREGLQIVITGGEPLCHPDLDAIAGRIRDRALPWGMVTNGWLLTRERAQSLLDLGMRSVTVSIDGLAATHDGFRGREGSWARAVEGVQHLVELRATALDVVTCAFPGNIGELDALGDLLAGIGVRHWRIFPIFPKGRAREDGALHLDAAGLRGLMDWIAARRSREGLATDFCCEGYLPPAIDAAVRDEPYFCRAGICIASVLHDGAISACPNIDRTLVQGNVRTHELMTVWEEGFQAYRDRAWLRTGECAVCREWKRCQGNSLHLYDPGTGGPVRCHYKELRR
jgi:radical SAM enzyme (rSAM/lipoprotein system)